MLIKNRISLDRTHFVYYRQKYEKIKVFNLPMFPGGNPGTFVTNPPLSPFLEGSPGAPPAAGRG
jgi:hypothetical protein